jgi:hypothetical protein
MQIDSLTIQLDKLFKKTKASEIFGVFDLYQTINRRDYLGYCKEVYMIYLHTQEIFFRP